MALSLLRIDERLIHGQVVVGWAAEIHPQRYIVVDDELADSEWEQDLYRLGVPDEADAEFLAVADARLRLTEWAGSTEHVVVLVKDPSTMRALGEGGGLSGRSVNIGGLHHTPERTEYASYVHLTALEVEDLRALEAQGARVEARDLPASRSVSLANLLGG